MNWKLIIAFVILLLALLAQLAIGDVLGVWISFVLTTLIVSALFFNFQELIFLILFAVFILNSQPALSPEIIIFSALPIIIYFVRVFVPLQPLLSSLFSIFVSLLFLYSVFSPRLFISRPGLFVLDLSASLVYGSMVFWILRKAHA